MTELKSCPFCGGEAHYDTEVHNGKTPKLVHFVECIECENCTTMHPCTEHAIAYWNRRAPDPSREALIEALGVMKKVLDWTYSLPVPTTGATAKGKILFDAVSQAEKALSNAE